MTKFGPIRVLVVDDDPDVAGVIAEYLTRESDRFEVETVTDPAAAVTTARDARPDCVVSDYDMPGMDGLELMEQLRNWAPELPFILFTGKDTETVGPLALERGVSRYLEKGRGGTAHFALLASDITSTVETVETSTRLRRQVEATDSAPEGICIVDGDGEIEYVNDQFLEMHGYDRETLVGRSWEILHPDEEVARVYREVLPTLAAAGHWIGEATGKTSAGETFEQTESIHDLPSGGFVIFATHGQMA
ncbi:response regulator [Salinirubellus salinus]|jgi:PAS domain S-box-containing protein|uniref:Response regulator n=1 Tax=Salinirubellus salinus TaxID=1364945 RepID=A0A9E7UC73_9EURY|nr:response regulator [Salinirubellus salinus]UWM55983.1 response regulator [Salinirubellus salinus]